MLPEADGIRSRLISVQNDIEDNNKRTLFTNILFKLSKIEREIKGVSRTQLIHISREKEKIEKGFLETPEAEAQAKAIIKHWSRVHDGHWESNFVFLSEELEREKTRIFGLKDRVLEDTLLLEYEMLVTTLMVLKDEYDAVQAFKVKVD
jgi:hypothetical protein